MVQLLATDPNVWQMAEQLLGKGNLVRPDRVRGIYCTLPYGDVPKKSIGCHVDAHPFHLGAVGYIDDVPPEGGGFTVWPGSHQVFYYDYHSQYKNEPTPQYDVIANVSAEVRGLNATAMQGILSSGIIASGMLPDITTRVRSGRRFYTTSAR